MISLGQSICLGLNLISLALGFIDRADCTSQVVDCDSRTFREEFIVMGVAQF